jgi:radical SAM superfamily enzyme YgiQ (UPF0313 family)
MKVLLVYPNYPDTFWSFKHVMKFVRRKAAHAPLGLLTVASMLPKEWEKKLVDMNVSRLKEFHLDWADMVFVSGMLVQAESAKEVIKLCNSKGKTVVAGGPMFTAQHEQFKGVDHFVLNEAEVTLPMFLADLEKGEAKKIYTSMERPDITKTPIPMWSLLNMKDYVAMSLQYSRGCPYNCEFCDIIILNGRVPRTKTVEQVLAEMDALYEAGWKSGLFIVDDNFIGNKTKVKELLPAIARWQKERNYPFKLFTEASINLCDDEELMRLMSKANFYKVFLGLETPNNDSLKECGKMQNVGKDLVEAVKKIHQHGMQVMGGFIVGFDSDTEDVFERQFRFIQQIGVTTAMIGVLIALPQTRLWHRLKEEGRLLGNATGNNTIDYVNFKPSMGKKELIEGYRKLLASVYKPKHYFKRVSRFLETYKPTVRSRASKAEIYAFFRSVWRIGIFSKACPYYWKLITKTFFTNFRAFPVAVEMSINWLHFQKVAKRAGAS